MAAHYSINHRDAFLIIIIALFFPPAVTIAPSAQTALDTLRTVSDTIAPHADTVYQSNGWNRSKIPTHSIWETVVSGPVWMAVSPAIAFLTGLQSTAAYLYTRDYGISIFELLVSADGTRIIYPFYSSRYGLGIQYTKKGLLSPESLLSLRGSYWFLQRASLWAQLDRVRISPGDRPLRAGIFAGYTFFPDESFYGIGNDSPKEEKTYYADREIRIEPSFEKQLGPWFTAYVLPTFNHYKISGSYNDDEPSTATEYTPEELPGVSSTALLGGVRGVVRFDTRDSLERVMSGMLATAQGAFAAEIGDQAGRSDFGLWLAGADYTIFLPLPLGPRRVLALRSVLEVRRSLPGKKAPFYLLSKLGGENSVRGLTRWRYYDNDLFTLLTAYSFPVWRFSDLKMLLDGIFFLDAGQVAGNIFTDFGFNRFHPGAGFGMRMTTFTDSLLLVLFGFGAEGVHVYVSLG